ncbi:uncharacterized protein JCM10292_002695 [Rhodotorula paludigena]|uniref:uncharacterized protein n=1 Tax=Rhodotorula paludigena TaxID=86838 RepID=UPI003171D0CE
MRAEWPDAVLEGIARAVQASGGCPALARLALVAPAFRVRVSRLLRAHPVLASSTAVQLYLRALQDSKAAVGDAHSLTLRRGPPHEVSTAGRGRKGRKVLLEDAVTEDELVQLAKILPRLVELHLVEPAFDSLRRRQLGFTSSLADLRTLTIVGRAGHGYTGFNLATVGQILQNLPELRHLALRNLQAHASALQGLAPPACKLAAFGLFDTPDISSAQLYWLLRSSIYADSLRSLAFDIPPDMRPSRLHAVLWAASPVKTLFISSSNSRALSDLPRHFPSLRHYAFRSTGSVAVDPYRVLASCAVYSVVEVVEDRSTEQRGATSLNWAEALLLARQTQPGLARLRRLALSTERRHDVGFGVLEEVCGLLGVQLVLYEPETGDAPWIPLDSAALPL